MTEINFKSRIFNYTDLAVKLFRYNVKIIFANRFIYFLIAAFLFFLLIAIINIFSDTNSTSASVYYILLLPGLLLIFYPTSFGIQNDEDSRMLEIIFSIPNYRYKVWLVRMIMIYFLVAVILIVLAILSSVSIISVPIIEMVYQLMYPIFFLGSLAFMFSTLTRSGNGTAVVMIIIGIVFWISSGILSESEWNIFLNPFKSPENVSENVWISIITNNRLYLLAGIILANLYGLLNLQKREKFM